MAMEVPNINPLTPLQTYYNIKANHKKFAQKTFIPSSFQNLKQKEDKRHNVVTSYERLAFLYPAQYIDKYVNYRVVDNALKTNPNITKILKKHKIEPKISMKNIDGSAKAHMFTTYLYSKEIAKIIRLDEKKSKILFQAALIHDIGKALIPEEIVQKPKRLTKKERKIIDLHSELGYEIIKTTNVPKEVAELIKSHHDNKDIQKDNILSLILSVADVFSALKEKRVYKPAMQDSEAFEIMKVSSKLSPVFIHILSGCQANKDNF